MDDDDQEIYAAPAESSALTSFQQIRKAFEAQQKVPIKVATDGRHKSNESDNNAIKPRPSVKPKLASGLGQNFLDQNTKPGLPVKKFLKPVKDNHQPPGLPEKTGAKDDIKPKTRTNSIRDTIYPPVEDANTNQSSSQNDLLRRKPLTPVNGHNVTPSQADNTIVTSKNSRFKRKDLPGIGGGPPSKPPKLTITISLDEFDNLRNTSPLPPEPDEVYDDIEGPRPDPPRLPPPPDDEDHTGVKSGRPVSMIPEMTEDEELDKEEQRKTASKIGAISEQQEVYDDVEHNVAAEDAEAEEIYEDI